jgi:hypothetical protein
MRVICEFLNGPDGEKSSKRLAGLAATVIFLSLSIVGGYVFLKRGDARHFIELLDVVAIFAGSAIGLGIFDNLFKARYANKNDSKNSDN